MVRTYKRKRTEVPPTDDDIKNAIQAVEGGMKLRTAAATYGIKHTTLFYRIKRKQEHERAEQNGVVYNDLSNYSSLYSTGQVFNKTEEDLLVSYILKSSKINYGLTYTQIRILAYDYAKRLNKPICTSKWDANKIAGLDWLQCFKNRHQNLALRKPENTSLSQATSFTKANVGTFFNNYERALSTHDFTPDKIYNLDETGISTVLQAPNIVTQKGIKQVGQIVSAGRGTLITMCGIINALGNAVPPVYIFPRARFHDTMLNGAPLGSLGLANSPSSGWMTKELFLKVLNHIKRYTQCSSDSPILILMDNHETHCSLETILFTRENGIVLVTFPPHTSHRLQPLDVAVYSSFKSKLAVAMNEWMIMHPGRAITIHDLAAITNTAYTSSFIMKNIVEGFRKTGTWPLNRLIFSDDDFDCAFVTDRPPPGNNVNNSTETVLSTSTQVAPEIEVVPSTSTPITPEIVRPFPKAAPRKNISQRKKVKSRVLTETPEKNKIEEETVAREQKQQKLQANKMKRNICKTTPTTKKNAEIPEIETSESDEDIVYASSDESEDFTDIAKYEQNDYILVKFATKKLCNYYVGQITEIFAVDSEFEVTFLKRIKGKGTSSTFHFPETEDISIVPIEDVVLKLHPINNSNYSTSRTQSFISFSNLKDNYNVN